MRRAAAVLLALAAGCDGDRAPPLAANANIAAPAPVPQQPPRAIGAVSGLSGQTSALTGQVSDFAVERNGTETRVALAADTLFAFDDAALTRAAEANLRRTADLVREGAAGAVTVTGYTDAKGDDAYNLDLSRRRGAAVAAWLKAQQGLDARSFAVVGRGEMDPVAPNTTPAGSDDAQGRARNRRVMVVIPR